MASKRNTFHTKAKEDCRESAEGFASKGTLRFISRAPIPRLV